MFSLFTFNPDAANSFSAFKYCDEIKYPDILKMVNDSFPSKSRRKEIIGNNPYATAMNYHTLINIIIDHIFGWDREKHCSKSAPGYFGFTKAFLDLLRSKTV
jgi:hypothetical protein